MIVKAIFALDASYVGFFLENLETVGDESFGAKALRSQMEPARTLLASPRIEGGGAVTEKRRGQTCPRRNL